MTGWKPLWEARDLDGDFSRRAILAGYYREGGRLYPKVGEAFWGDNGERGSRWIWKGGGDVVNPLGFQEMPDFPIPEQNTKYVVGHEIEET